MTRSPLTTRLHPRSVGIPNPRQMAQIASWIVIAISCLVLIGWQLDLSLLKIVIPGHSSMKANTAVCFLCAGISLLLQTRHWSFANTARIASINATVVNIIAFVTICQYVFGWNFGIDELLFADPDSPRSEERRVGKEC